MCCASLLVPLPCMPVLSGVSSSKPHQTKAHTTRRTSYLLPGRLRRRPGLQLPQRLLQPPRHRSSAAATARGLRRPRAQVRPAWAHDRLRRPARSTICMRGVLVPGPRSPLCRAARRPEPGHKVRQHLQRAVGTGLARCRSPGMLVGPTPGASLAAPWRRQGVNSPGVAQRTLRGRGRAIARSGASIARCFEEQQDSCYMHS